MTEFRVYEATTGNCIAGDRWGRRDEERSRVEADFAAGTRLVIDERQSEIRGFIPATRSSPEAFYAVFAGEESPLETTAFAKSVSDLFGRIDHWSIRTDTAEGQLLSSLRTPATDEASHLSATRLVADEPIRIGVPTLESAGAEVQRLRSQLTDDRPRQYIITLSRPVTHITPDLTVHVSTQYDTVLTLEGE